MPHLDWLMPCRFQSTLPRRERRAAKDSKALLELFQSTLPRRERPGKHMMELSLEELFQSTLPRRERHYTLELSEYRFLFQSTLPRRERPLATAPP